MTTVDLIKQAFIVQEYLTAHNLRLTSAPVTHNDVDWTSRLSLVRGKTGRKTWQHGTEDRLADYRVWRWEQTVPGFTNDVPDQVENGADGKPVALLELTRGDEPPLPPSYLANVWDRFTKRDKTQIASLRHMSEKLGVPGYIVVFQKDLSQFIARDVQEPSMWVRMDQEKYLEFLTELRNV